MISVDLINHLLPNLLVFIARRFSNIHYRHPITARKTNPELISNNCLNGSPEKYREWSVAIKRFSNRGRRIYFRKFDKITF